MASFTLKSTQFKLTPSIKEYVQEKIGHLDKLYPSIVSVHIELGVAEGQDANKYRCEVTIYVPRDMVRAEEEADDMHAAIDLVVPKLRRQLEKYHEKEKTKHKKNGHAAKTARAGLWSWLFTKDEDPYPEENYNIVKRKRFSVDVPMTERDAIERMNLIGHTFFLFFNRDTNRYAVVYHRDDGNYGLIEPKRDGDL